jgi:hypothetical protein
MVYSACLPVPVCCKQYCSPVPLDSAGRTAAVNMKKRVEHRFVIAADGLSSWATGTCMLSYVVSSARIVPGNTIRLCRSYSHGRYEEEW